MTFLFRRTTRHLGRVHPAPPVLLLCSTYSSIITTEHSDMAVAGLDTVLAEAQAIRSTDPKRAEDLYRRILETSAQAQGSQAERESNLRIQESALISLGELYRDNKYV